MALERKQPQKQRDVKEPERQSAAPRPTRRKPVDFGVLDNHLGYSIRRLQVWVFQDFIRRLREIDIRPAQFSVLVVISSNPGLSQADVAESLGIERARLVHLLDLLEERQLIQRLRSTEDRRSHSLHLTAEGQRVLKRAQALAMEHEAKLESILGADHRSRLLQILRDVELPA